MIIKGLLVLMLLLGMPTVILFGLVMRWYRTRQEEKAKKELEE